MSVIVESLTLQSPISTVLLAYIRTIAPLSVLLLPILFSLPLLRSLRHLLARAVSDLAPLSSLVPAHPATAEEKRFARRHGLQFWQQLVFVVIGFGEAAVWMAVVGLHILDPSDKRSRLRDILLASGMVIVWVSASQ